MKKRKILVSLALASACLFSLASCGGDEEPTPTPTTTTVAPAPTTTTTTSSTNSNYEELTSTIDMKVDDIPAGKAAKDIVKGVFTIVQGSELRERTRTWTNPEDSTDEIIFERSIKMGDDTAALKVNVAPGIERVLSVYVQNGSSSAKTQKIKVTKPDGSTYTIEYAGNDAFGGYPGSSVVVRIDIEVTDGEWKIQRNSGTTDLYAATLTGKFEKSEISGFEIASEGKTEYMVGEDYSSLDVVVNAVYGNGRRDQLARTDYTVDTTGVDMNTAGEYDVKIKYGNYDAKTIKITVTALNNALELGFNRIEKIANSTAGNGVYFNQTVKRVYKKGETLDTDDLSIKTKSADGTKYFDIEKTDANLSISNVDMSTTGEKTVTVTYELGGTTATGTFKVYVVDTAPSIVNNVVQVKVDKNYTGEIGAVENGFNMFTSIQQALDFLENNKEDINSKQKLLSIAAGKYTEKLEITVPYLTITGAGKGSTVIEWNSLYGQVDEGGFTHTTDSTQTVAVREAALNCTITELTISNYWNNYEVFDDAFGANYGEHRALALLVQSDKFKMKDAKLLGYQDTVEFFTGRQYLEDCYISGTTDFIFGTNNTTYFKHCEVHTIDTGKQKDGQLQEAPVDGGYTTAFKGCNKGADDYVNYGAIFYDCTFTADSITAASHNTALGRPWGAYAAVAYINCNLGEHFSTTGYNNSSKNQRYVSMNAAPTEETVKFVEYGNYGYGAVYPAVIEGTTTEKNGAIAFGLTAGDAVPANKYYEIVMDGNYPKMENGRYVVKLTTDTTFDATKVQNKQYMVEVTVSGYKFLTATEAANYTDFTKIYGETNGKVTYDDSWDPTAAVVIQADNKTYYTFNNKANPTGTSVVLEDFELKTSDTEKTLTVNGITFDATNGGIKKRTTNDNQDLVLQPGGAIKLHVTANTSVQVVGYYSVDIDINGTKTTATKYKKFFDAETDVVITGLNGSSYLTQIVVNPEDTAPQAATLSEISVSGAKEVFELNDAFSTEGLVVTASYSDNSYAIIPAADYTVDNSNVHMDTRGKYTIRVSYQGKTAEYEIQVGVDLTINQSIGTSFKGTKWGNTYNGLVVLQNAIDATTEAKIVNNMTFTGFKSNGGSASGWLKCQSTTNTITFDVAGPCKVLISYYNASTLSGTTVGFVNAATSAASTIATTDTFVNEADICSYVIPAAGRVTITSTQGGGNHYLGMVYVDMVIRDSAATSYKSTNYSTAYTNLTINTNAGIIDSTTKPVFLDGMVYDGGVKSNNSANNWLAICNGGSISFDVAGPCKLYVAYFNASSMANTTVKLGTSDLTVNHLENRGTKEVITELRDQQGDVAVYEVTAQGKITISFTGSGYLGMVGVEYPTI